MDESVSELLTAISYTNFEIKSLLDILEEYTSTNAENSKCVMNIYNLVQVIKSKHQENCEKFNLVI